mmetsp:Transcript_17814/g.33794  ORF Transcript_17814/g.33794 Transcript_17814/m.33794 type:complete len:115 (+) Transcript_17814:258-602(+)
MKFAHTLLLLGLSLVVGSLSAEKALRGEDRQLHELDERGLLMEKETGGERKLTGYGYGGHGRGGHGRGRYRKPYNYRHRYYYPRYYDYSSDSSSSSDDYYPPYKPDYPYYKPWY